MRGTPYPLGVTWDGDGTNFALFSRVAERVELRGGTVNLVTGAARLA